VKRLKIKEFKTNHRILECGGWSFLFGLMEMYPVGESLYGKIGLWLRDGYGRIRNGRGYGMVIVDGVILNSAAEKSSPDK
jgi:hypothetical protein